jgi:uroporphyrin-III C-methyltransferase
VRPPRRTTKAATPQVNHSPLRTQRTPSRPVAHAGSVSLVGAGPGDPELLTVKAIRAIRSATVLLVDDLVGDGVLRYARRSARVIHVGKRGGCASTPQAFIHKLMVAEAQRGEAVVRLKGGDPFIFGRGGEEAEHLRAAGIAVRIVNGISSGLAAASALGVPWTHREHAHGVLLVTGHAGDCNAAMHWPTLAAAAAQGLTLVVYMGVQSLPLIQRELLTTLGAGTPAALVQHASTAQERRLVTTLGALVADAAQAGIASPAILIVGDVLKALPAVHHALPWGPANVGAWHAPQPATGLMRRSTTSAAQR